MKLRSATKYLIKWDEPCRSKIQKRVKDLLHQYWFSDVVFEEFPVIGTRLTIDFYNANKRIALEVDGNQHYKYSKFFHGDSRQKFFGQICRDEKKELFCRANGIRLVRILDIDILTKELLENLE